MTFFTTKPCWLGPRQLRCRILQIMSPMLVTSQPRQHALAVICQTGAETTLVPDASVALYTDHAVVGSEIVIDECYVVPVTGEVPEQALQAYLWPALCHSLGRPNIQHAGTVLLHRADSYVGMLTTLLAKHMGYQVFAITYDRKGAHQLMQLGAMEAALYGIGWPDIAREHGGVDAVLDPTWGQYISQSLVAVRRGGRMIMLGLEDGEGPPVHLLDLFDRNLSVEAACWDPLRDSATLINARLLFDLLTESIQQLSYMVTHCYEVPK